MSAPDSGSAPVVLITGAAGGLGRGLVRAFAAQRWRVVATYHRATPQTRTPTIWPLRLDVTRGDAIANVLEQVRREWQGVQALVNNAGVIADAPVWQLPVAAWERVLDVNLRGAFLCCRAVLPFMVRQHEGQIINVASFSARQGTRGQANYAAAKAGLIGLTLALAREGGPHNVRVNAVLPGALPTPMTGAINPARLAEFAHDNVLGRLSSLEEVARFTAFLARGTQGE